MRGVWTRAPFVITAAVLAAVVFVQLLPGNYRTERSVVIASSPAVVYRRIEDLRMWRRWSPWNELDLRTKLKYEGPRQGVGASYTWDGSGSIGQGRLTIIEADVPQQVLYRVEFIAPWNAVVHYGFSIAPVTGGSRVTWVVTGKRRFWSKFFGVFTDADEALGAELERGLAALKQLVERRASS